MRKTKIGLVFLVFLFSCYLFSCGDNFQDGERMARDCLALHLLALLERALPIPSPSSPESISIAPNESLHLIEVDIRDYFPKEIAALESTQKAP